MRTVSAVLVSLVLLAGGAALALAGDGGSTPSGNAAHSQYDEKPGCGPDKTGGVAGGSGYHDGQPPKEDERKECPKPPGHSPAP